MFAAEIYPGREACIPRWDCREVRLSDDFEMSPTITTDGVGCQKRAVIFTNQMSHSEEKEKLFFIYKNSKTWIHFYLSMFLLQKLKRKDIKEHTKGGKQLFL